MFYNLDMKLVLFLRKVVDNFFKHTIDELVRTIRTFDVGINRNNFFVKKIIVGKIGNYDIH